MINKIPPGYEVNLGIGYVYIYTGNYRGWNGRRVVWRYSLYLRIKAGRWYRRLRGKA